MALPTDRESIARHCISLIEKAKNLPPGQVMPETSLEDLQIDSLDKVSLAFDVEEAYGITISDTSMAAVHTVDDIITGVTNAVAAKQAAAENPMAATEA